MHLTLVPALAQATPITSEGVTTADLVQTLVAVVLPILVGLVTKASTDARVKAILLALLSALSGVAQGFLQTPPGTTWDWQQAVLSAVTTFVIAVAAYYGLWKPTGVSEKAQATLIKDPPHVDVAERLGDAA
jgi:hypothetical protein